MIIPESDKPYLIALEGPAGAGKTTLQRALGQAFTDEGIRIHLVPEFSDSPLGGAIRNCAHFGQAKPSWLLGLSGILAFLSDKVHLLDAARDPGVVWISDRFITSQLV